MSPEEIADKLRDWADKLWGPQRDEMYEFANKLDPLVQVHPEPGTVVRFIDGDLGLVCKSGMAFVGAGGTIMIAEWGSVGVSTANPVRILADDEVAVKKSQIQALLGEVGE